MTLLSKLYFIIIHERIKKLATLLIGDFRGKQLQQLKYSSDYTFIVEDTAECSWFSASAIESLPLYSLDKANVVIMLGFNDCVYSCVWEDTFNLDVRINSYVNTINKLVEDLEGLCKIDAAPKMEGKQMFMIVSPA